MPTHTIDVTAEDIARGKRCHAGQCPIALAAKRTFPDFDEIEVDGMGIDVGGPGLLLSELLPDEAVDFADKFDNGEPVEPFRFVIGSDS